MVSSSSSSFGLSPCLSLSLLCSLSLTFFFFTSNSTPPRALPLCVSLFPNWRPPKVSRRGLLAPQGGGLREAADLPRRLAGARLQRRKAIIEVGPSATVDPASGPCSLCLSASLFRPAWHAAFSAACDLKPREPLRAARAEEQSTGATLGEQKPTLALIEAAAAAAAKEGATFSSFALPPSLFSVFRERSFRPPHHASVSPFFLQRAQSLNWNSASGGAEKERRMPFFGVGDRQRRRRRRPDSLCCPLRAVFFSLLRFFSLCDLAPSTASVMS